MSNIHGLAACTRETHYCLPRQPCWIRKREARAERRAAQPDNPALILFLIILVGAFAVFIVKHHDRCQEGYDAYFGNQVVGTALSYEDWQLAHQDVC